MNASIFLVSLVLLIIQSVRVDSIKCHQCTSLSNAGCGDPFTLESSLKECPAIETQEAILCRKLRQTIDTPNGKMVRITRSCGYISNEIKERDENCFRASFTAQSSSRYCTCSKDGCNSSYSIHAISAIVSIAGVLVCLMM